jgi:ketosteroid isomerase-like protein
MSPKSSAGGRPSPESASTAFLARRGQALAGTMVQPQATGRSGRGPIALGEAGSGPCLSSRDTWGAMSEENVEIVRKLFDAVGRGDPSRAFDYLDPDVVWEAIEDAPDAGTYRGHSGVKRYMDDWLQDFEDFAFEFAEPVEVDGRLVLEQWGRNRGKGSGVETEIHYAAVYTFRRGKVFTVKEYNTYAEALEAAGLRE